MSGTEALLACGRCFGGCGRDAGLRFGAEGKRKALPVNNPGDLCYNVVDIVVPAEFRRESEAVFESGGPYAEAVALDRAFLQIGPDRDNVAFDRLTGGIGVVANRHNTAAEIQPVCGTLVNNSRGIPIQIHTVHGNLRHARRVVEVNPATGTANRISGDYRTACVRKAGQIRVIVSRVSGAEVGADSRIIKRGKFAGVIQAGVDTVDPQGEISDRAAREDRATAAVLGRIVTDRTA